MIFTPPGGLQMDEIAGDAPVQYEDVAYFDVEWILVNILKLTNKISVIIRL